MAETESYTTLELTAEIVASHVANNSVHAGDLPTLIQRVHKALSQLGQEPEPVAEAGPEKPSKRAITASIKPEFLVSFLDGKPYKMLKRHLTLHGHTPESYREAFGLPRDYPMSAASYSEKRRELAKAIGLGRKPGQKVAKAIETVVEAVTPAKRTRKPKKATGADEASK